MIQQSKINSFIKSITDVASDKKAKLDAETEEMLGSERAAMKAQAKKAASEYIRAKSASIKLEAGRRISESAAQSRKAVFSRRAEIAEGIFSAAAEKLRAFTASPEYVSFLIESAGNVLKSFDRGGVTLRLRPEDMKFKDQLSEEFPNACFSEDNGIKIGGIKGIDSLGSLMIDDSLDSRLESQKKWFEENSGLYISMR